MEGRFSPGAATVLGAGVASHACAARAYQTKAHPRRDNGEGSQCGGVSPNLLPAMDPVWENAIRDWLIPLNLDTNHGYAKEPVVNSELVKQRTVLEKRLAHLHRLAAESRKRLRQMRESDQVRKQQIVIWEQQQQDLLAQVAALEVIGQSDEPGLLAIKAKPLEAEWEVHHRRVLQTATSMAGKREMNHCEQSCRPLRLVLRQQEELRTCEREMQELDNSKDQIMTLLKVGLANLGMGVRDHYFGESYQ